MDQKKQFGMMGAVVYAVIFAAYNLFIFLIFNNFNAVFWISYAFMLIAYAIHVLCAFYIGKNASVKAVFFGIPLISFSVYFVFAEFFASLVFMIFRQNASVKITVLIQALLLCAFIVVAVVALMTRDVVMNTDNKIKESVSFIKGLNVDIEMLIARSKDAETTGALRKLSETVKYSDPMSNSAVSLQEQMIMKNMSELRATFDSGDMTRTRELCSTIELLFVERNKKLMISK